MIKKIYSVEDYAMLFASVNYKENSAKKTKGKKTVFSKNGRMNLYLYK